MSDINTAVSRLLSLIFPVGEKGMTAEQKAALAGAAELQAKFEEDGEDAAVKSRSVGDVSVTYADAGNGMTAGGRRISPDAAAVLRNAGLLCRWV